MSKTKQRPPADLRDLQGAFRLDVVFAGDPDGLALPCWFAEYDDRECSTEIQGCHFINRQRIRNYLWALGVEADLIVLAEWDPRLAVPGCTEHHPRWDGHLASLPSEQLRIMREEVPAEVEEAVAEWGLETPLEERCPSWPPCPECGQPSGSYGGRCFFCRGLSTQ